MFNSRKMLQIISYLLILNDYKMDRLKLIKELYLIDRMAIDENNMSISKDEYFSLKNGPILSHTLDMLNGVSSSNEWSEFLKIDNGKDITLIKEFDEGRLSRKDKEYIKIVSDKYKSYSSAYLVDYTHSFKEWVNPKNSRIKIHFADIMRALGKSEDEIIKAKEEYQSIKDLYSSIGIR